VRDTKRGEPEVTASDGRVRKKKTTSPARVCVRRARARVRNNIFKTDDCKGQ